jgi:hypothetical protein
MPQSATSFENLPRCCPAQQNRHMQDYNPERLSQGVYARQGTAHQSESKRRLSPDFGSGFFCLLFQVVGDTLLIFTELDKP